MITQALLEEVINLEEHLVEYAKCISVYLIYCFQSQVMLIDFKTCIDIHDQKMYKLITMCYGQDSKWNLVKGILYILLHLYNFSHNLLSRWPETALIQILKLGHQL